MKMRMDHRLKEVFLCPSNQRTKGFALVLTLVITAVCIVFGAASLSLLVAEWNSTQRAHRSNQALYLAESGVEEAVWQIKYNDGAFAAGDGWSGTNPKVKTASLTSASGTNLGSYTVTVTDPTGSSPIIESVGQALYQSTLSDSRTVQVVLSSSSSSTFTRAAFADVLVSMDSNSCTDSFDSRLGSYDGPNTTPSAHSPYDNYGSEGDVGTNGTSRSSIDLDSNVHIYGDVQVGVGGVTGTAVTLDSNSSISGTRSALTSSVAIPSVSAPTGLTNRGSVTYNDRSSHTISSSGQYTNLTLTSNTSVTIDGNVTIYVSSRFQMDSNSELIITDGSSVKIYVGGAMTVDSNSDINNVSQDASMLSIYGIDSLVDSGSNAGIQFDSNTTIYATILAPNSSVNFDSNSELFGAVVSDKVRLGSNTCIHYDVALGSGGSGDGADAEVATWQEK